MSAFVYIYIQTHTYMCMHMYVAYVATKSSPPTCVCVLMLLHRRAPPAAVELVISSSGWRAMETKSADVTSPPGYVLTESIISTPL